MKNIYSADEAKETVHRINKLTPETKAQWGKMNVSQMLAHCNVAYAYVYEPGKFKKPGVFKRFLLKKFVKPAVTTDKPYSKGGPTAPEFVIKGTPDFEKEKQVLIKNILRTQELGEKHFDGLENLSFGNLSAGEWNFLFGKHINHHLTQFGV